MPFDADNFMGVLTQHMYKAPTPLRELRRSREDVSPGLEAIVMKCLSKRPEHRYQSMEEVIVDIDRLLAGTKPQAVSERGAYAAPGTYYDDAAGARVRHRAEVARAGNGHRRAARCRGARRRRVGSCVRPAPTAAPEAARPEQRAPESVTVAPVPATPVVASKQVTIATEPLDAHIFRDGKDLGQAPVNVEVPEGTNVELQIIREGYKNARVVLDGSEGTQAIKLEKVAAPALEQTEKPSRPQPRSRAATKKRPSLGSGEIIDPWSK